MMQAWEPGESRPDLTQAPEFAVRPGVLPQFLAEVLQSFRRPAVVFDASGVIVAMNMAAIRCTERAPADGPRGVPVDPRQWRRQATFQGDGQTYQLAVPDQAFVTDAAASDMHLPPRLAKIARLVVAGCTDKQIAARTGLSFSTVRTYVRQIYRRVGVHNRVELVHSSNTGLADA